MMVSRFSELVDTFQRGAIPRWLVDYVQNNRQLLITQLQMNGVTTIPSPDQSIVITIKRVSP
jgi:hypothetical protein